MADSLTRTLRRPSTLAWVVAAALALLFPVVEHNAAYQQIGVYTLIFTACATSWNMFSGYSGYVNLGAGVSYGTGAYTMAIVARHLDPNNAQGGASLFWVCLLSGVAAMVVAVPIGLVALRVRRHTFVVITIAIFFTFQLIAINASFTGGTGGLFLPYIPWNASYYDVPFYYVGMGMVLFAVVLSALVRRSRFGLQLLAIRDDEDRAMGLGVEVGKIKLTGYVMSAFTIGMCGGLFALLQGQIYPQFVFNPLFDISIALMCFFGGFGTLVGPILGAVVLESSQQYLTVTYSNGSLYLILFGALFLIVILFMPQGIVVFIRQKRKQRLDRRIAMAAV
jgi:branched-chain amino acid transport system permease protein